jgi:hypothetical protein
MSTNVEGFGTILETNTAGTGTNGGGTWVQIAELAEVEPPESDVHDIDRTHMQSAAHTMEFQAGLINPGEAKIKSHFIASNQASVAALMRVPKSIRISLSDPVTTIPSRFYFEGYLKKIGAKTPLDDIVVQELTFKVSGPTMFVAAS